MTWLAQNDEEGIPAVTADDDLTADSPCAGRRRRGSELEQAILTAALDELGEHGMDAMTMEGVAAAARTGKASLYRRWSSKEDLVLDAIGCAMPHIQEIDVCGGDLRSNLLAVVSRIAAAMGGPYGALLRALLTSPEVDDPMRQTARERFVEPRLQALRGIVSAAIARGEARPGTDVLAKVQAAPAIVMYRTLVFGEVGPGDVVAIVDDVLMPLFATGADDGSG